MCSAVTLSEEIVALFTRSRKLTDAKILEHLISPRIQKLYFPVYSDDYLVFFPKLGNLLILDLQNSRVGNNWLKYIGAYCFNLRYVSSLFLLFLLIISFF